MSLKIKSKYLKKPLGVQQSCAYPFKAKHSGGSLAKLRKKYGLSAPRGKCKSAGWGFPGDGISPFPEDSIENTLNRTEGTGNMQQYTPEESRKIWGDYDRALKKPQNIGNPKAIDLTVGGGSDSVSIDGYYDPQMGPSKSQLMDAMKRLRQKQPTSSGKKRCKRRSYCGCGGGY